VLTEVARTSYEVILHHTSPEGATVTHVRGGLLRATLRFFKSAGLDERCRAEAPAELAEAFEQTLASSSFEAAAADLLFGVSRLHVAYGLRRR
jgi:hypothetical protein